jgi:hypothetical protein
VNETRRFEASGIRGSAKSVLHSCNAKIVD